ncbi:PAAR domain-containing protein [Pseudomonas helleri]|uniref:PAAR domain-containing protein n=1 Tax=Pseudomonas helleri TaxID=1608996 RepID=UPI002B211B6E|nr:PAAR domain-containing protein [Pseudomonas helleri]
MIRLSDTADYGGAVIESILHTKLNGNLVMSPLCKGPFHIVESGSTYFVNGVPVAKDGMKTACGVPACCISPPMKPADQHGTTPTLQT